MTDREAITDLIHRWAAATASGDVDTVLSLMTEDTAFLVTGQPPMRGRATFGEGLRHALEHVEIESRGEPAEILISGNLAVATTKLQVRITPRAGGATVERSGYTLTVFEKQSDGAWLLKRDANLLPPPK